jgi:hypothetical protein
MSVLESGPIRKRRAPENAFGVNNEQATQSYAFVLNKDAIIAGNAVAAISTKSTVDTYCGRWKKETLT